MNINRERLAHTFSTLCETDSPSRHENKVSQLLKETFSKLDATELIEDNSASITGSDCGNLIIRFQGTLDLPPIFFSCHMDTVEPARGVKVKREGDRFTSAGETVLGSDDKSGLAACIELVQVLQEGNIGHRSFELIITTCEEIGLLGAKALDPALIQAKEGYALDSSGFARVITHAPAANKITITVHGVAAHAGLHPEWGVSAIMIGAQALVNCPNGKIDHETTANIGIARGGAASNIVAEQLILEGETRSHDQAKLEQVTGDIQRAFTRAVENWNDPWHAAKGKPSVDFAVENDFPIMELKRNSTVINRVEQAARKAGIDMTYEKAGGGSDANIFNGYGLPTAIIATGMTNVHSTSEQIELQDMVDLTRLLVALVSDTDC